ncbi:GspE/PulE family protein [Desulfonatronovibrio hydrogenovorans]|uniref:GspE/PulE family protein n=1 Tax=Desulfonatronovibrio hydrogenovorans TaxID=53245 RepID=UPI0005538831|nr:GspE/PulE family protein [Desulfonatronovibrio hydrogenovorans]
MAEQKVYQHKRLDYTLDELLEILGREGVLSLDQIGWIRSRYRLSRPEQGKDLDFIISLGLKIQGDSHEFKLDEERILRTLADHFKMEFKRVDPVESDIEVTTRTISEGFARQNMLVPLRVLNGCLEVLAFNPFQPEIWEDMEKVSSLPCKVFLGTRHDILRLIDDFYQFRLSILEAEKEFASGRGPGNLEGRVRISDKIDPTSQRHIIKAVDYLMRSGLRERASDIHMEPRRNHCQVRFRIDGVLHSLYRLPPMVHQAMLSRIKGLSGMDIAEKRRPQDGRIQLVLDQIPTDVRVSTVPVAFGEKMVLRLLSGETTLKKLDQLGMDNDQLNIFRSFISRQNGLILVTGPTGSGKSTTLYSTLKELVHPGINLVTLEDPIEMVTEDFNQIGIRPRIGVDFAGMLKYVLRQDPDIIMVGEMRDSETAHHAVQAALTGHLVLSTLHTTDASSSLTRLLDMGLESYLINAAVVGTVAQRLVRTICPHCREKRELPLDEKRGLGLEHELAGLGELHEGSGCEYCRKTGYLGRMGIYEIVGFDQELKEMIRTGQDLGAIREKVRQQGVPSLFQAGINAVRRGQTTIEEVLRVVGVEQ